MEKITLYTNSPWKLKICLKNADGTPFNLENADTISYALVRVSGNPVTPTIAAKDIDTNLAGTNLQGGVVLATYAKTETEDADLKVGDFYLQVKIVIGTAETVCDSPVFAVKKGYIA